MRWPIPHSHVNDGHHHSFFFFFKSSPEDISSLLLEREEGRERNIDVREPLLLVASLTHLDWGSHAPRPGIEPAQARVASSFLKLL